MPTTTCPRCGREIQFTDTFFGCGIACPAPGCGQAVQLPNADGTMPQKVIRTTAVPPPLLAGPRPAEAYYLRRPDAPDLVVGPLPRERLRQMAAPHKLQPTDELSADRRDWRPALRRDPG